MSVLIQQGQRARRVVASICRSDFDTFVPYIMRYDDNGQRVRQGAIHKMWTEIRRRHRRAVIEAPPELGKALALDTRVLTASGWVPIRDVHVGDIVYDLDGHEQTITDVFPIQLRRPVYDVVLDDGTVIAADDEHQWHVLRSEHRGSGRVHVPYVRTTKELRETLRSKDRCQWYIPNARAIQHADANLPIDPYVLGAWLGDGRSSGPSLTFHIDDRQVYDECVRRSGLYPGTFVPKPGSKAVQAQICGLPKNKRGPRGRAKRNTNPLAAALRGLRLLGNKHIPDVYFTTSEQQRRDLLAGLMDTDGTVIRGGATVEFTSTNRRLADGVCQLVRSLGYKTRVRTDQAKLNGRVIGPKYRLTFTPDRPVFLLERKRQAQGERQPGTRRQDYRVIRDIRARESVPVRCISVTGPSSTFIIDDYVVTHNSASMAVAYPLWLLGNNPKLRIAIVAAAMGQATKSTRAIMQHVERNQNLQRVFPDLRPGDKWTESSLTVARPIMPDAHPSIQALGVGSMLSTGSRIDVALLDDVVDRDNTKTKQRRDEMEQWFWEKVDSRMTANGRIYILSNTWDPDDLVHRLAKQGWAHYRCPLIVDQQLADASRRLVPHDPLIEGASAWPERWPMKRVDEVRCNTPPVEFARARLCVPASVAESRFKQEWFDQARDNGRHFGFRTFARKLSDVVPVLPDDWRVYAGVDLATGRKGKDLSSIAVVLGSTSGQRYLLHLESGKWHGDDLAAKIAWIHRAFECPVAVESVGMQDLFVELLQRHMVVPIEPFDTNARNKFQPVHGVESFAAELQNGKWTLPFSRCEESDALIAECLSYNPTRHTGDRLMAVWFARTRLNAVLDQAVADADALGGFAAGLMGAGR